MRRFLTAVCVCLGQVLLLPGQPVADASFVFGGARFEVPVTSFKGRRFVSVVQQQFDYSCGAAAVATLLTYHFGRPTSEREAFDQMFNLGDRERIQREGFSLFEIKLFLQSIGFEADGFRVTLDKVAGVGVPVIVMISINGYRHFVVIKGLADGYALVGDPAFGLKRWKATDLIEAMASDVVFAIHNANEIGQRYFNAEGEWALLPRAPLGNAIDRRSLSTFSVMLPGFNEFF